MLERRTMTNSKFLIVVLIAITMIWSGVNSFPAHHDQRQEGDFNVRADLQNFLVLLVPSTKNDAFNLLDFINKAVASTKNQRLRTNNDDYMTSATEETNLNDDDSSNDKSEDAAYKGAKIIAPYQVEIGANGKKGHQKSDQKVEKSSMNKKNLDNLTLLGSTMEQCGPDMKRNVNGICELINHL